METIINDIIESDLRIIRNCQFTKECLELRIALIKKDYVLKNEYEKNELDILRLKTETQIDKLTSIIKQKTYDLNDTMKIFEQELEELQNKKNG